MDERKVESLTPTLDPTRAKRMRWWKQARYGMFIHFGPYSVLGRGEWAMQQEHIKAHEYTRLGEEFQPKPGAIRAIVQSAAKWGMRYVVLTSKHCDGFHLWRSDQTEFCATKVGPKHDLVKEFVDACREFSLGVGIYYGLMDWRHPDGDLCAIDEEARKRFVRYTHENVRELMTNYGKIDILWFDGPWPMPTSAQWESRKLIDMVRALQPHILINNRARIAEDFSTPEGEVNPKGEGREWEACMTLNGDWGYSDTPEGDWRSSRDILRMLRTATGNSGNLLLNVGPKGDGSIPEPYLERLGKVAEWLKANGEAVYGEVTRIGGKVEQWLNTGFWTLKGNVGYFWLLRGKTIAPFSIARIETSVKSVRILSTGQELKFRQEPDRLFILELPEDADPILQTPVLKVEFEDTPKQKLGAGMMLLPDDKAAWW